MSIQGMVYDITHISSDLLTFTSRLINIKMTGTQCYAPQNTLQQVDNTENIFAK